MSRPTRRPTGSSSLGPGILSDPLDETGGRPAPVRVAAEPGLAVVHRSSGFSGEVVSLDERGVLLRGATGLERRYANAPGVFLVGSRAVHLVAPSAAPTKAPEPGPSHLRDARVSTTARTASGSRAVVGARARVARASRLLVEGVHDAELVEKVWGDDLRIEGIVVERLDGLDHLDAALRELVPGPGRRVGVLVDHLVPGSKESRVAEAVRDPHVLVTGHPYVDVWQAVRPAAVGITAWPVIERGTDWKSGVCAALAEPDPAGLWRRILASTSSWKDLEQPFIRAVEQLIDFVTEPDDRT